jgi:subtilase family serine protease
VGCTSSSLVPPASPSAANTPTVPRSDLVIQSMYLEMADRHGLSCVEAFSPYGIRLAVRNVGVTPSGPFEVELNGVSQVVTIGLDPGQTVELHYSGTVPSGQYVARVDPANQAPEEDEGNNESTFIAPTPSPPPLCTPGPS